MKSNDVQNIVLSKRKNGDGPKKIFEDLNGAASLPTIKRWCKMLLETGAIQLIHSPGRPRTARSKKNINKIKARLKGKKPVTLRQLAQELDISHESVRQALKSDLRLKAYKKTTEPLLTNLQKIKRKKFCYWVHNNFKKEDTLRILFSDEKLFDLDGVYSSQNDRVWAASRTEADEKGGKKQKRKFPQKVMVWLGACSEGLTPLIILDNGTVYHERYIKEVLPVALKYGRNIFGDKWTFQQDGATCHTHRLTQKWCADNFPAFLDKHHWPPNSPDLNPLDYSIWNELAQAIKWDRVTTKKTLIQELKVAVKRVRKEVVLESCLSWTSRLKAVLENEGGYIRK
jgi:transposase